MNYGFSKTVLGSFDEVEARVREALQKEGFGVLTEINVQATLKKKLDVDFRPYKILGACNPSFAHKALSAEAHIGLMLPCNVVVQQGDKGIEVSAIDPIASMMAVKNDALGAIASEVREKMRRVVETL
ncbi:MAG TPA: DUF302 domain-containing protein [Turneriella sp.]|nr:DUF302 domain-containing protein [Turneriella sp.]